jgi:hypothetical protein
MSIKLTRETIKPIYGACLADLHDQKGLKPLHNEGNPFEIFLSETTFLHGIENYGYKKYSSGVSIPKTLRQPLHFKSIELEGIGIEWGKIFIQHGYRGIYYNECIGSVINALASILKEYGYEYFLDRKDRKWGNSTLHTNPAYPSLLRADPGCTYTESKLAEIESRCKS